MYDITDIPDLGSLSIAYKGAPNSYLLAYGTAVLIRESGYSLDDAAKLVSTFRDMEYEPRQVARGVEILLGEDRGRSIGDIIDVTERVKKYTTWSCSPSNIAYAVVDALKTGESTERILRAIDCRGQHTSRMQNLFGRGANGVVKYLGDCL
ncbi:hypothetical protein H6504_05115 [Candidatus Woesearchaeota archaeon]|nr:hypothetical protein [Candidatus Woesearchaeota archaeon]